MTARGRTVVVTGASAGVGRAIARELGRHRDRVALLARGVDGLDAAARELREMGATALVIPTDVARPEEVEAAAERAERELGPIDVWINDAMVTVLSRFVELTPEELRRVTEVTYLGMAYGILSALRCMVLRDHGHVVQVGSALAYRSIPLQSAYCGAKHAIRGLTDSIRSELLHDGSRVHLTMVQLPAMNTPQFSWCRSRLDAHPQPVPPIFEPEVAARAVVECLDQRRREVMVGEPTVRAIVGNKLFPGLGDHLLARTGFDGQTTTEIAYDRSRADNLFEPLRGDWGAHGVFGRRAHERSLQQDLFSAPWGRFVSFVRRLGRRSLSLPAEAGPRSGSS